MRDSKTCKHYKQGDCKRFNPQREYIDCGDCEDYERRTADIYREAETVPVVTEQAETEHNIADDSDKGLSCEVCGEMFRPTKDMLYVACETVKSSILMPPEYTRYDCVDCPYCGRQIVLGVRLKKEVQ